MRMCCAEGTFLCWAWALKFDYLKHHISLEAYVKFLPEAGRLEVDGGKNEDQGRGKVMYGCLDFIILFKLQKR